MDRKPTSLPEIMRQAAASREKQQQAHPEFFKEKAHDTPAPPLTTAGAHKHEERKAKRQKTGGFPTFIEMSQPPEKD